MHHLFRSSRGRLFRGGCLPQGSHAKRKRRAARQRRGHAALSRRSADAGRCRQGQCEAAFRQGCADDHQDSRPSHLVWRRQAAAVRVERPVAPEEFRGSLAITYHIGPGPAKVHLKVESNWDIKPIRDIIAKIPGSQSPEQWIIRGNHHDAWVNGAEDPISGQIALLEEARSLSELLKQGWKPKRTIIFFAWDGEEPGLLGSTEWCEDHAEELAAHAALYVNSDGNGRGFLNVEGSHSLEKFVNGVARDIIDPEKNMPVADRLKANFTSTTPM